MIIHVTYKIKQAEQPKKINLEQHRQKLSQTC